MSSEHAPGGHTGAHTSADEPPSTPSEPDEPPRQSSGDAPSHARVALLDSTARLRGSDLAWLDEHALAALAQLPAAADAEISVRIVGDREMARSHERHTDATGTTDVLTFDLTEDGEPVHADLLVCLDEAERQARAHEHPVTHELLLYILHGCLHCMGHDDTTDEAGARMHAEEDRVLHAIGIGPVFDPDRDPNRDPHAKDGTR